MSRRWSRSPPPSAPWGADRDLVVLFLGAALLARPEALEAVSEVGGAPERLDEFFAGRNA